MRYPKIKTLFLRKNPEQGRKSFIRQGAFSSIVFPNIKNYLVTEKIDGKNIRLIFSKDKAEFKGRTDKAQFNPKEIEYLQNIINRSRRFMQEDFIVGEHNIEVNIFAELFGYNIQKAGHLYSKDHYRLAVFDFAILGDKIYWQPWEKTIEIADKLNLEVVPILDMHNIDQIVRSVSDGFNSQISENRQIAEGIVAKAYPEVFFQNGNRVMFKLKYKDFYRKVEYARMF